MKTLAQIVELCESINQSKNLNAEFKFKDGYFSVKILTYPQSKIIANYGYFFGRANGDYNSEKIYDLLSGLIYEQQEKLTGQHNENK